jgi:protein-disulfide isomerase
LSELRRQRLWQFGAATVFAAVVVTVVIVVSQSGSDSLQHLPEDRKAVAELFDGVPQHGLYLGDQKAAATLVTYEDLQCPFCRAFTLDTLPVIIRDYVEPGKLRLRFQPQTILGEGLSENQSETAARYALATSLQNRLWQFTDLFYRNQDEENSGYVTDSFLQTLAKNTKGLDVERATRDAGSAAVSKLLDSSTGQFSSRDLKGTPSFVLEQPGKPYEAFDVGDASDAGAFTDALDSALRP